MRTNESIRAEVPGGWFVGSFYTEINLSSTLIQVTHGTVVLCGSGEFRQRILQAPPC